VASALLALAEHTAPVAASCFDALVLGIDVARRVGNAMYPTTTTEAGTSVPLARWRCRRLRPPAQARCRQDRHGVGIAAQPFIGMRECLAP
jgi:hypothetical protein